MKIKGWKGAKGDRTQPRFLSWLSHTCVCLLILTFLAGCQQHQTPQGTTVKVLRVVSGQTLELIGTGTQSELIEQVRLIGLDAPDLKQRPWGPEAKKRLEELIGNQPVILELGVEAKDSFGRKLAYVWKDGVLLNERLLLEGNALFQSRSLNTKYDNRLERAQEWARVMGLGIWNPNKPMRLNPAEFRSQNR